MSVPCQYPMRLFGIGVTCSDRIALIIVLKLFEDPLLSYANWCFRGVPRCRKAGESNNTNARTQMSPYLLDTSPHTQIHTHIYIYSGVYHTRGRTLLSQSPHTNESILCHEPSPRTIVTCPSCTVYPTDPVRSRTPAAELHHSGTMMSRHTIGNPIYETPDLRRPVLITAVSQTAPYYSVLDTTGPGQTSQIPRKTAHPKFHPKYAAIAQVKRQYQLPSYVIAKGETAVPNSVMKNYQGKTAIPITNFSISIPALISQSKARQ